MRDACWCWFVVRGVVCVAKGQSPCDYGISTVSVILSDGVTRIVTVRNCRGPWGVKKEWRWKELRVVEPTGPKRINCKPTGPRIVI